eukprot:CCRYP_017200-RA/>CCRYP_017200-RA protein AED:0.17 eAED:0.17 QI:0/0.83/0.57/1/0.83/0.71/7/325/1615
MIGEAQARGMTVAAVIDNDTGDSLEYRHLVKHPVQRNLSRSYANEARPTHRRHNATSQEPRLCSTSESDIPKDRLKSVAYSKIVVVERPQKKERERTRLTVVGTYIDYPGVTAVPTSDLTTAKLLFNSVISTDGATFHGGDLKTSTSTLQWIDPSTCDSKTKELQGSFFRTFAVLTKPTDSSNNSATIMAAATTLSLREWIKCALKCCTDSVNTSGNCSGPGTLPWDYLLASLKIAVSLSDEIQNAEDLACISLSDELSIFRQQTSNGSMPDCAEFVTVRLKDDQGGLGEDEQEGQCTKSGISIEPIPYSTFTEPGYNSMPGLDGGEAQALLDYLNDDCDESLALSNAGVGCHSIGQPKQDEAERRYLSVHSAHIEATYKASDDCEETGCSDPARDKQRIIYLLGLVFYELFSGGEKPPPELLVSPSCLVESHDAPDDAKKPSSSRALDFARSLQVNDDSKADEECDLFSEFNNWDGQLGCAERPTEDLTESCSSFQSQKRQSTVGNSLRYPDHFEGNRDKKAALCRVITRVSIEQLKLKGLPGSLSNVIYNMIDCINGDFSGDQSYSKLSDVTSELKLMVEYPDKFLRDLDVSALSMTPLSLNETVFVRDDEFASLQCAYRRSASGSPEIALITGESGTGKTWLANRIGRYIVSNRGVFLQGKFDRLHRTQPFSVLATAFNAYCDILIRETDRERAKLIASKLQEALGPDACQLVKVIPTLKQIIVYEKRNDDFYANQNYKDAEKRLYYLMCRFVETISSYSDCIVALFLDDLQWADDVSISIVGEILKSSDANKRFFFLGSYRDDIENDHPVLKMIENVQSLGVTARTVKLECMDRDVVTKMLSHLLCLFPRLVRSFSDIVHHKTKGNPLFFSQFMLSLNRDGLLYLSLSHRRWEWDEEKIMSRSLPDDVAVLFSQRIDKLPSDVKLALNTLSCFGAAVEVDVIKELEAKLGDKLIDPLAIAEKEGFVSKMNAKYVFGHDRIQEAAYGLTPAEERCLHHMKFGLALAEISLQATDNNRMLFVAVGQINLGGPSAVSNDEQRLSIVKYNLAAGKMALDMSEFHSAFNFFDNGITFLKKSHWTDHYDLSLELYELAAECAVITGDMISLTVLTDQVTKNARCFEDTLHISYICMSTLSYSSISDAVEMGLEIMSKLGEELPRSLSSDYIELQIKTRQSMLDEMSVMDLLNYRMMTDKKKIMAMKFLRRLWVVIQQVHPNLMPLIPLKMVEITMEYGLSHMSPIGFALFGSIVAKLGDIKGGHKFTSLAKSLIDILKLRDISGEVFCVASDILCFIEPFPLANENRKEIEAVALAAGDVTWSCYSRVFYVTGTFWSGSKLSVSSEVMTHGRRFVMSRGHLTSDNYLLLLQQTIFKLIGDHESEIIPDDELKQRVLDNYPYALEIYYFQKTFASFMLDNYESMKESAVELFKFSSKLWLLISNHIFHELICGLVSFRLYRETKLSFWLDKGTNFTSQMHSWGEQGSSWTFENKCFLLKAEEQFSNDRLDLARASYDKAISSAKAHKLVHEEAMAYELAAKFYFNINDFSTSLKYYTAAHEKYSEWGAYAKAKLLVQCIEDKFSTSLGDQSGPTISFAAEFEIESFDSESDQRKRKQP